MTISLSWDVMPLRTTSFTLVSSLAEDEGDIFLRNIGTIFSETSVQFQRITCRYIPETELFLFL
jgi:hypothetical protein